MTPHPKDIHEILPPDMIAKLRLLPHQQRFFDALAERPEAKRVVLPPDMIAESRKLISADYSQIEQRLADIAELRLSAVSDARQGKSYYDVMSRRVFDDETFAKEYHSVFLDEAASMRIPVGPKATLHVAQHHPNRHAARKAAKLERMRHNANSR